MTRVLRAQLAKVGRRSSKSTVDTRWWHWDGTSWQPPAGWVWEIDRWVPPSTTSSAASDRATTVVAR